ncbi:MAG: hypothetical protein Q9162_005135 [Coniocarpon cinnabarinum]
MSTPSTGQLQEYMFGRDLRSSARLNLNHWLFKAVAGYLLHPKVACLEDAVIADIGCHGASDHKLADIKQ